MKRYIALALLSLFLVSCSDDSNSGPEPTFSVVVNGQQTWEGVGFINSLEKFSDTVILITGKRMDIRVSNKDGENIVITATDIKTGTAGNCITLGDGYILPSFDSLSLAFNYNKDPNNSAGSFAYGGFLNITECNEQDKRISGEFAFIVQDPSTGDTLNFSGGQFANQSYFITQ